MVRQSSWSARDEQPFGTAARESWSAFKRAPQWTTLAWNDIKLRYRRTTLGPLWITMGLGATVFSVGILYGLLFGNELSNYLPYLTAGLISWTFVSTSISEGCAVFLGAAALIRSVPVPFVVHVYRMLARQLIMAGHNVLLMFVLSLMFPPPLNANFLLFVPGLLLATITVFGLVLFLGTLGARFRDVQLIVTTAIQLIFLLTPVMWDPTSVKGVGLRYVADLNPFFHLVEVMRRPLLGQAPQLLSWFFVFLEAAVSLVVGMAFYAKYRQRIPFWV